MRAVCLSRTFGENLARLFPTSFFLCVFLIEEVSGFNICYQFVDVCVFARTLLDWYVFDCDLAFMKGVKWSVFLGGMNLRCFVICVDSNLSTLWDSGG